MIEGTFRVQSSRAHIKYHSPILYLALLSFSPFFHTATAYGNLGYVPTVFACISPFVSTGVPPPLTD